MQLRRITILLLICKETEKPSGFVSNCYSSNPIVIIENMGLVQLRLKVTHECNYVEIKVTR